MTDGELALRSRILGAFAATGDPPDTSGEDPALLRALAERHVVVLDPADPARILMAHPFAAHRDGTRVDAGGRTWWGNCAWDGLGIVAALGLRRATVTSGDVVLAVDDDAVTPAGALFHVAVPASAWWEDIAFT
jgi:hypothetical protein